MSGEHCATPNESRSGTHGTPWVTFNTSRVLCPWHSTLTIIDTGRNRRFTCRDTRGTPRVRDLPPTDPSLRVETLVGLRECRTFHNQNRISWVRDAPPQVPLSRIRTETTLSIHHVYEADQNCAGLKRWRDTETRRQMVSGQTERNFASVVEDVHKVDNFSHGNVQVHQQSKTP